MHVKIQKREGEPSIDLELYDLCDTATPHIAGYSLDGKLRGTDAIVTAALDYLDLKSPVSNENKTLVLLEDLKTIDDYREALSSIYSAKKETELFKREISESNNIAKTFDAYRKSYPARKEINYDG